MTVLDEATIERFRTIGLVLDRAGVFWHQGVKVEHPRLHEALLRWLDVRDDGRDVIRLDDQRYAYVTVEDAHLRARSVRWEPATETLAVLWDDDLVRELEYATLAVGAGEAIYARVGRLRGRIAGSAYHQLVEHVVERADGTFALRARGAEFAIRPASPT